MNYLDLETLSEKERITRNLKKKFEKQGLYAVQYIYYYLRHSTKYKFSTLPVHLAIKNFDYGINHVVTRKNNKIKTWWLDSVLTYKFINRFDYFLSENLSENQIIYKKNLNQYIEKFISSVDIEDIKNTDNQWLFNRSYFFWQCYKYEMSKIYSNVTVPETLTKNNLIALDKREYKEIDFLISEERMEVQLEPIFSKKEIIKMFEKRIFRFYGL